MSKSEILTVRLDPKLRYLAELGARKQRRTLSSYIEWALEQSLSQVNLYQGSGYNGDDNVSVADIGHRLWDVDESERFVRLAMEFPELLTHEEQQLWKMLVDSTVLSQGRSRDRSGAIVWDKSKMEDYVFPRLRTLWTEIDAISRSGADARQKWVEKMRADSTSGAPNASLKAAGVKPASSGFEDMDDDIPF